jgi:hypothetical protein
MIVKLTQNEVANISVLGKTFFWLPIDGPMKDKKQMIWLEDEADLKDLNFELLEDMKAPNKIFLDYLNKTEWVESYILKHDLNLDILPETSNKLKINKERIICKGILSA